jgi:hypothetical protein
MVQKLEPILVVEQELQKLVLHLEQKLAFPLVLGHMHLVVEGGCMMVQLVLRELRRLVQTLVEVVVEELRRLVAVEVERMRLAWQERHMVPRLGLVEERVQELVLELGWLGLAYLDLMELRLPEKKQLGKVVGNMVNMRLLAKLQLEHYQMKRNMPTPK